MGFAVVVVDVDIIAVEVVKAGKRVLLEDGAWMPFIWKCVAVQA